VGHRRHAARGRSAVPAGPPTRRRSWFSSRIARTQASRGRPGCGIASSGWRMLVDLLRRTRGPERPQHRPRVLLRLRQPRRQRCRVVLDGGHLLLQLPGLCEVRSHRPVVQRRQPPPSSAPRPAAPRPCRASLPLLLFFPLPALMRRLPGQTVSCLTCPGTGAHEVSRRTLNVKRVNRARATGNQSLGDLGGR
jgi:hypothetical protein